MKVEYRDIGDFPGYRIGSDGTVWCCRPINGKGGVFGEWRLKAGNRINRHGHTRVDLYDGSGARHLRYVHRLVLEAFVGDCPDGHQCCHNDGDPTNNSLPNLRWDTAKSNMADKVRHGTINREFKHPQCKVSDEQVREIRDAHAAGQKQSDIGARYGLAQQTVSQIISRRRRFHVA